MRNPEADQRRETRGPWPSRAGLPIAVALFAVALAAFAVDAMFHERRLLDWFDLGIYNHAGLIARHDPRILYSWQLRPGIQFTYTPFAALLFAGGSELPPTLVRGLITTASGVALLATVWFAFGAVGRHGRNRVTATLALSAVSLWTWPVLRALRLGQIELLLMVLIVWDLCQSDTRRWKGTGIGVAAGIKLTPLIFIPYLLLCRQRRQAAAATLAFALTVAIGFVVLPGASVKWWLSGYFLHAGRVGGVGSVLNQSLRGLIVRELGNGHTALSVWLGAGVLAGVIGLTAAAYLHRSGHTVTGWSVCALTGLLVSPISWDHHWVWIVPVLVVIADSAARARGGARLACLAALVALASVFGGWPEHWTGPMAFAPHGLLGFFVSVHMSWFELIGGNLYVLSGLAMLAVAIAYAAADQVRARANTTARHRAPAAPVVACPASGNDPSPRAYRGAFDRGGRGRAVDL